MRSKKPVAPTPRCWTTCAGQDATSAAAGLWTRCCGCPAAAGRGHGRGRVGAGLDVRAAEFYQAEADPWLAQVPRVRPDRPPSEAVKQLLPIRRFVDQVAPLFEAPLDV